MSNVAKTEPSPTTEDVRFASWVVPPGPITAKEMRQLTMTPGHWVLLPLCAACGILLVSAYFDQSAFQLLLAIAVGMAAYCIYQHTKDLASENEWKEFQQIATSDSWFTEIRILQQGTITGQDRGVLWCEDGKLNFAGVYTSFALTAAEFRSLDSVENSHSGHTGEVTYALNLPNKADLRLSVQTLAPWRTLRKLSQPVAGDKIIYPIQKHLKEVPADSRGQFPPFEDGPMRPSILGLVGYICECLISTTFYAVATSCLLGLFHPGTWVLRGVVIVFFVGSGIHIRVRALYSRIRRDLRQRRSNPRLTDLNR